ncbi:hypothetical protein Ahu01nite_073460 [Winogradskya humida]|uniref:Uncharacterized protein n=1 Tax=Winogradskya humida TaxID=113566 RepID=A0ABQ4A083_9ACTN|nr:hypothetical protein Ahu01nite_073460 [Actinoplanes humidus]
MAAAAVLLPAEGETVLPLAGADSALAAPPETLFDFVPYPGAPAGDADLYLKQDLFLTSFASQVKRQTAQLLYAAQRPRRPALHGRPRRRESHQRQRRPPDPGLRSRRGHPGHPESSPLTHGCHHG